MRSPLLASLLLIACGGSPKPAPIETTPPPAEPAPAPAPAPAPVPPPAPPPHVNPLLTTSPLYEHAPVFDQIKEDDFVPAYEAAWKQHDAELRAIADQADPPTFDNTIVALEKSGQMLTRVDYAFGNLASALTDDKMQQIEQDTAPRNQKHRDAMHQDPKLFARVDTLWKTRKTLKLDPVEVRLIERYHSDFVRAGAQLKPDDQAKLRALNEEESSLQAKWNEQQLKEMNAGAIVVDDVKDLDGMSESDIAAAAAAATTRGKQGKWVIPLVNTTTQPALASLKNRALRQKIYEASIARGHHGGEWDMTKLVPRLAQLRAQKAKLLGFSSAAAFILDDQMAKTPQAAMKLLGQMTGPTVAHAKAEAAELQKLIDSQKGGFKLAPWDWQFYSEQLRKAKYALDNAEIRPYFELDHVLKDGVFFAAHQLYGVTVKPRTDLPVYHPDVRAFEVFDADGSSIGIIYIDYFARESKHGGAWMNSYNDQSDLLNEKPVVSNCLNIPKPAAGQPALLTFDEVTTAFHEFGHGLHGLLSKVKYPYMSGTNTPRDFVEYPSQFNENWALEPTVFANYAKHYQTGAAMPQELVEKIKKAKTFGEGFATLEALEAQLLDLEWHALPATAPLQDPEKFEAAALKKHGVDFAPIHPRYHTTYFSHIWGGGYQAGYYAYMWTAVLAADSFAWFTEHGGMTAENGKKYRDGILSKGATKDAHQLYVEFRGKEPSADALLKQRGLK
ncbi:MAG: M3 family metallopeptidase [Kofleriaceae bacterium]